MAEEESLLSHLVELRDRMIKSLVVVLVMFVVCFYFSGDLLKFLSLPLYQVLPEGTRPIFTDQAGAFFTLTKVSFLSAFLVSMPWILYQAWQFVAPGLYEHERKFAMPLILSSVFFLVLGIAFAYTFVLPAAYGFFIKMSSQTGADILQDLEKYWDFTLAIFFGFGLTFEVPVVQMLLVKAGLVTTAQLRTARRYVVVGAFVLAAVLTPPDVLSQFMLAVPLMLLYELGIYLAGFITARSRNPEADEANDDAADTAADRGTPGGG
ncbi:MAG: twin-arginine translocase subunit TatC [Burkholderiaceae bacterium]